MSGNISSAGLLARVPRGAPEENARDGSFPLQNKSLGIRPLPLPLPQNCSAHTLDASTFRTILQGSTSDVSDPLAEMGLQGLQQTGRYPTANPPVTGAMGRPQGARKGWRAPGPGAPKGLQRNISDSNFHPVFTSALSILVNRALSFFATCNSQTEIDVSLVELHNMDWHLYLGRLLNWEGEQGEQPHKNILQNVWMLHNQLGVPGFLFSMRTYPQAIAIYLKHIEAVVADFHPNSIPEWYCSNCTSLEIDHLCFHGQTAMQALQSISDICGITQSNLKGILIAYCGSQLTEKCSLRATSYGLDEDERYVVIRERDNFRAQTAETLFIAKKNPRSGRWSCLSLSCSVIAQKCSHALAATNEKSRGGETIQPLNRTVVKSVGTGDSDPEVQGSENFKSHHARSLVPSKMATVIEEEVSKATDNRYIRTIGAPSICACGASKVDGKSPYNTNSVQVECMSGCASYLQHTWTCANGHIVSAEESEGMREGLVWLSRYTAYTEHLLFHYVQIMVFGGATASAVANARHETLNLRYDGTKSIHRSAQSFRKALFLYIDLQVKGIPGWLFRCPECVSTSLGVPFYDQLAFDGLQVGFKKTKTDASPNGIAPNHSWRIPVGRRPEAAKSAYVIANRDLRSIIFEVMKARIVPHDSSSVGNLCRAFFKLSLNTDGKVVAAVAAIKLLDPEGIRICYAFLPGCDNGPMQKNPSTEHLDRTRCPLHMICGDSENNSSWYEDVSAVFAKLLYCRRMAMVLCHLVLGLNKNLRGIISSQDFLILQEYSREGSLELEAWRKNIVKTLRLNETQSQGSMTEGNGMNEHASRAFESTGIGIKKLAASATHWVNNVSSSAETNANDVKAAEIQLEVFPVCVRLCGSRRALYDCSVKLMMLVAAVLNEPACVWIRNSSLGSIYLAIQALELSYVHPIDSKEVSDVLNRLELADSPLLCEGVKAAIDSTGGGSLDVVSTLKGLLQNIPLRHHDYRDLLYKDSTESSKNSIDPVFYDRIWLDRPLVQGPNPESQDFRKTGVWAPEFPVVRPAPFENDTPENGTAEGAACIKKFKSHDVFSPGTFVVTCLCRHPKCLAVLKLQRTEGCRMPLNFILERCTTLPSRVIYDFACGTMRSALGISLSLVEKIQFVVDRFHFAGHKTCSLAFHANAYRSLQGRNTASQEQRNSLLRPLERTLRGSSEKNFMNITIVAHALQNAKALFRDYASSSGDVSGIRGLTARKSIRSRDLISGWSTWIRERLESSALN